MGSAGAVGPGWAAGSRSAPGTAGERPCAWSRASAGSGGGGALPGLGRVLTGAAVRPSGRGVAPASGAGGAAGG